MPIIYFSVEPINFLKKLKNKNRERFYAHKNDGEVFIHKTALQFHCKSIKLKY